MIHIPQCLSNCMTTYFTSPIALQVIYMLFTMCQMK